MKFLTLMLAVVALSTSAVLAEQAQSERKSLTPQEAKALYPQADETKFNTPFEPSKHAGAQWYPKAGFGLFIHWGIYATAKTNPSWAMYNNRFGGTNNASHTPEEYYALSEKFNPQQYNPDEWMKLAKKMGMQYAVLTTKHHDGYCLWPTKYGKYNTANYMGGRDLVKEYVEAARRHGLKVGFYFSPRDWAYNDHVSAFGVPMQKFDGHKKAVNPFKGEQNEIEYNKWLDYTIGQMSELLTNYGEIDVLWFDGANWNGVRKPKDDIRVRNWIYQLQPQIVINPRWGGKRCHN